MGHTLAADAEFAERFGLSVTDPAATWMALAAFLQPIELVIAADHLVLTPRVQDPVDERPFVPLPMLVDAVRRHSGRHIRVLRSAVELVRDGAESAQETRLRLALVDAGLPEPLLNVDVTDARGRFLGRGDMVYPEWGVIVEYDGDHHRTDARQYDKDLTRHEAFTLSGWRHVRVRRFGMAEGPTSGVARTEAALRSAGWRPGRVEKSPLRPNPAGWT
ncbi:hypothetical protein [Herbiconiux solani]|uniref:hypothetical protein n=1 Tax=Herbiconiux solani TaxID=661329 RepID=UPI0012ED1F14|nr:hypothetical protein [Herbiconiux solani]